ncbi:extracellular solute-binding protein [Micromonospora sp. BRA006-A]|nr:extracellular solute-binding protein [Micromonospora sp. BRA006-A]
MDVLGLDVTWTQEFASAKWIRRDRPGQGRGRAGHAGRPAGHRPVRGQAHAAPKNTNVQLLWYRSDLASQPPETWDEMISAAQQLKEQGKPYQVLTMGAMRPGGVSTTRSPRAPAADPQ